MKISLGQPSIRRKAQQAFTLVDAIFAILFAGLMFSAMYSGLAFGFTVIKMARENTRATQIMLEKMETIRLYTWDQINTVGFIPTNPFPIPYYAVGTNSSLMYTGQVFIEPSGLGTSYADNMRKVTIRVDWSRLGASNRTRSMSTYVTKNGMQSYVY